MAPDRGVRPRERVGRGVVLPELGGAGVELDADDRPVRVARRGREGNVRRRDEERVSRGSGQRHGR